MINVIIPSGGACVRGGSIILPVPSVSAYPNTTDLSGPVGNIHL